MVVVALCSAYLSVWQHFSFGYCLHSVPRLPPINHVILFHFFSVADGSIARWGLASTLTIHYIQLLLYTDGSEMRCCSRGMSAAQSPFLKKREIMVIIHLTQSVFQITTHRQHFTHIHTRLTLSEFIMALPNYKELKMSQLSNWLMFHLKLDWNCGLGAIPAASIYFCTSCRQLRQAKLV